MRHYIAIFVEDHMGEWRVVFPDAPGCEAKAFSLHDAQYVAATALMQFLNQHETPPPLPMDMAAMYRCEEWLERNQIDLSKAVVSIIPLAA